MDNLINQKLDFIEKLYNRTHKDKWSNLSDDEKAEYYDRNIWRYNK
jgi:hypothetical protein